MFNNGNQHEQPRLLPSSEVRALTTMSRATLWRRIRAGQFPPPIRLGNRNCWLASTVSDWINSQTPLGQAV